MENAVSTVYRSNRKATDADIVRMNSVGLSLTTIGRALGCHPTTVTLRLRSVGVEPADTRRTFMEDIFVSLPVDQQEWLADQLGAHMSIKDFMRSLIVDAYISAHQPANPKGNP